MVDLLGTEEPLDGNTAGRTLNTASDLGFFLGRVVGLIISAAPSGGVAQLVERLHGMQEVRGFDSHRLHRRDRARLSWRCVSDNPLTA